jgi:hypothetical protein
MSNPPPQATFNQLIIQRDILMDMIKERIVEINAELAKQEPNREFLESRSTVGESEFQDFQHLMEKILGAVLIGKNAKEKYAAERRIVSEIQMDWVGAANKVNNFLHPLVSPPPSHYSTANSGGSGEGKVVTSRLPKVELVKYSGELREWLNWWSDFSTIHDNDDLNPNDKFKYLMQSLIKDSEAWQCVVKYPRTGENYQKAIDALKRRFGRVKLQQQVYIRELIDTVLTNVKSREKFNLPLMFDKLDSSLKALTTLGVTALSTAEFLYPMVESSLPEELLHDWKKSSLSKQDGSTLNPVKTQLDFLMEFLGEEVDNIQDMKLAKGKVNENSGARDHIRKGGKKEGSNEDLSTAAGLFTGQGQVCIFCEKNHVSAECYKAQQMTLREKTDRARDKKCCLSCLRGGHISKDCRYFGKCLICAKKHVTIMCPDIFSKKTSTTSPSSSSAGAVMTNHPISGNVLLQTLLVRVYDDQGENFRVVRLVLDSGSQGTSIRKDTARQLRLKPVKQVLQQKVLYGGTVTGKVQHNQFNIRLTSIGGGSEHRLVALDETEICGSLQRVPHGSWLKELRSKNIRLSDFESDSEEIEILVGSDYYGKLLTGKIVHLSCGLLAMETVLGWTLSGRVPKMASNFAMFNLFHSLLSLQSSVADLWSLELLGIKDPAQVKTVKEREEQTKEHFLKTVKRSKDGRYYVSLPWIDGTPTIPDNKLVAEKRLISATKKLMDENKYDCYDSIFNGWMEEGFIEEVKGEKIDQNYSVHYLPHRPVFKPESLTTPVRPVFDASCKTGRNPSLNECMEKGPNLLELIPSILHV